MGYFVKQLERPYTTNTLVDAFVYTLRDDFIHEDFSNYYKAILPVLERKFGISFSGEMSFDNSIYFSLFHNTARSMLEITSPLSRYQEASLLHSRLEQLGDIGIVVNDAFRAIHESNELSEISHRAILHALFTQMFGEIVITFTSEDLRSDGFDDTKEPDISDYYDLM